MCREMHNLVIKVILQSKFLCLLFCLLFLLKFCLKIGWLTVLKCFKFFLKKLWFGSALPLPLPHRLKHRKFSNQGYASPAISYFFKMIKFQGFRISSSFSTFSSTKRGGGGFLVSKNGKFSFSSANAFSFLNANLAYQSTDKEV